MKIVERCIHVKIFAFVVFNTLPTGLLYCSLLQTIPHSREMNVSINEPFSIKVSFASLREGTVCGKSILNI